MRLYISQASGAGRVLISTENGIDPEDLGCLVHQLLPSFLDQVSVSVSIVRMTDTWHNTLLPKILRIEVAVLLHTNLLEGDRRRRKATLAFIQYFGQFIRTYSCKY